MSTPCDPNVSLSYPVANDLDTPIPNFPYQEIVKFLLYLATHSWHDIAIAVSIVAQYSNNFIEIHCIAVKHILKYLRGTTNYVVCYSSDTSGNNSLAAYLIVDYKGDLNDRKSCSGSVLLLNHDPIL